ncbi:MAG: GntR family transcriptional regulator [Clostridiales bacterium]|nr:GntR family transcriptional regulator [Clostridiales bacterium]
MLELFQKQRNENAKGYAYRVIKNNIMILNLKPGDLINESELASSLNLSRTPIREVLMKLKAEKLIQVRPQVGTYVAHIDWNLIKEALFMRYNLEKEVLKEACINFKEENLLEMEKNIYMQKMLVKKKDALLEFHELDNEFHKLLFQGVNKENVWEAISTISTHYKRIRLIEQKENNNNAIVEHHQAYIDMIKNKEKDKIEELILEHLKSPETKWDKIIKSKPDMQKYIINYDFEK